MFHNCRLGIDTPSGLEKQLKSQIWRGGRELAYGGRVLFWAVLIPSTLKMAPEKKKL